MLWIILFVYAYSRILELFSPFNRFKNKTNKNREKIHPNKKNPSKPQANNETNIPKETNKQKP